MSVNNSLITKQHDRPFISMCRVVCVCVCAGIRVCGVRLCGEEVGGAEWEVAGQSCGFEEEKLQTSAGHAFCMHTEFCILSLFCH